MRTTRVTRKNNDWENAPGRPITCPCCGKILQKSTRTNSIIYCPRCSYASFTFREDNVMIQCPARLLGAEKAEEHIKTAVGAMRMLQLSPIIDYDYIPEDDPV